MRIRTLNMDTNQIIRVNKLAEKFWVVVVLGCLGATIWFIARDGWEQQKQTLVLPAIALAWLGFRRFFRKKLEKDVQSEHK